MRFTRRLITALLATALALGASAGVASAEPQRDTVDFHAIVKLSNCSGSVFRFTDATAADPALVLTNGHCVEPMPDPGEVVTDQPSSRTFELLDASGDGTLGTLTADRLLYATMTGTDAAVYRLDETYGDLAAEYDTEALTLAEKHPRAGTDIAVVSGYWRESYSCAIDGFVHRLKEDGYVAKDAIRYTRGCETIGGTSGSPVIDVATGRIVGVNNTGYDDTGRACSLDNPCEVDPDGDVTVVPDARYGQQTYQLRTTLDL